MARNHTAPEEVLAGPDDEQPTEEAPKRGFREWTAESKARLAETMKSKWTDPDYRSKTVTAMRGRTATSTAEPAPQG